MYKWLVALLLSSICLSMTHSRVVQVGWRAIKILDSKHGNADVRKHEKERRDFRGKGRHRT
jgi:hypothetical protein